MAFKASNQIPADGYVKAKRVANALKGDMQGAIATMQAGPVTGTYIRDAVYRVLAGALTVFNAVASIPNVAAYAQAQEDDDQYDVAAEFVAMVGAIEDAIAWIATNIPKDGGGFAAIQTWNANGTITERSFSAAATAGLVTELQAVTATIS